LTKDITLSPEENALLEEFFGAEKIEKDREGLSPATTLAQHFLEADLMKASIGLWRGKRNARSRRRFRDSEPSGQPSQEYGDSRRSQLARQLRAAKDKAILSALRDGYSGKQISCYLGVSPSAISKRLQSILGVRPHKLTAVERDNA
jgi:hypothetical protein